MFKQVLGLEAIALKGRPSLVGCVFGSWGPCKRAPNEVNEAASWIMLNQRMVKFNRRVIQQQSKTNTT